MATKASLSNQVSKTTGVPYAVALLATVVALLLRLALNPFLGDYVPYITLFPAVAFCAWYCGIGPGHDTGLSSRYTRFASPARRKRSVFWRSCWPPVS